MQKFLPNSVVTFNLCGSLKKEKTALRVLERRVGNDIVCCAIVPTKMHSIIMQIANCML